MTENNYRIKLGKWCPTVITEEGILYQCSECGNIDDPDKDTCSNCRAKMIKEVNKCGVRSVYNI